ncbi:hypothetical protein [Methylobacterium planeticum]|uniref:hypothetical protein n=1 Tax=Methylobacterium planeticum TaxID=2615211 RepID=UPI00177C31DA|nr:hypothetical protein [Methylobacterium planeticum]
MGVVRLATAWFRRDIKILRGGMMIAGARIDGFHPSVHCLTTPELIEMARASRKPSPRA